MTFPSSMEAWREQQDAMAPAATESDWHRQWHAETGLAYGCPQDACHPPEEGPDTPAIIDVGGVRCGNAAAHERGARHASVEDVRMCFIEWASWA